MKLIKTTGRTKAAAYELLATLERRGAVKTAEVEPVVRKIMRALSRRLRLAEKSLQA